MRVVIPALGLQSARDFLGDAFILRKSREAEVSDA